MVAFYKEICTTCVHSDAIVTSTSAYIHIAYIHTHANVAQSVEHFHGKEKVGGSNPLIGSSFCLLSMVRMLDIWDIRKKVVEAARKLPAHVYLAIQHGKTYGRWATFSLELRELLSSKQESWEGEVPVSTAMSHRQDGNRHTYLVVPDPENAENDIIIDPTASQFIGNLRGIFIWTRKMLREVLHRSEIINTRSKNDPDEAFDRTRWEKSRINY